MGKFTIRNANVADAEAISNIGTKVFNLSFGHAIPEPDLKMYLEQSYTAEAFSSEISDPLKKIIVACNEQQCVVGFAQLTIGTSDPCLNNVLLPIELQRVYVHQDYHKLGIGKLLMEAAEDIARSQGFKHIWLGVWEENQRAQKVYASAGYEQVGVHDFQMGSCIHIDWILIKTL
jgi:ribosomal protein S18 acetylase RimI-like enzyme